MKDGIRKGRTYYLELESFKVLLGYFMMAHQAKLEKPQFLQAGQTCPTYTDYFEEILMIYDTSRHPPPVFTG